MTTTAIMQRMTEDQLQRTQDILEFPLIVIAGTQAQFRKRLIEDGMADEVVDVAIMEYRRFLCMVMLSADNISMLSSSVDAVWHLHIQCTEDYRNFCKLTVGFFVHHRPNFLKQSKSNSGAAQTRKFQDIYFATYGETAPEIWSDNMTCKGHCDVADCDACKTKKA